MSWDQLYEVQELKVGLNRNINLIDLMKIPNEIQTKIWEEYQTQLATPKKVNIIGYLQKHKLKTLMEHVGDF